MARALRPPLPEVAPVLHPDEIHLWGADLSRPATEVDTLAALLSPDEHARAERFRQTRDRDRFVVARGILRVLLGGYLGYDPASVRFAYRCACGDATCTRERRKPTLTDESDAWLQFNLSHADGLALFAVARGRAVGVDLERHDPALDFAALTPIALAASERADLHALPAERQPERFFRLWTAKEAYLKATGTGLRLPPDQVVIATDEAGTPRLSRIAGDAGEAARWHLASFAPCAGWSAAVVSAGPVAALRVFAVAPAHASAR